MHVGVLVFFHLLRLRIVAKHIRLLINFFLFGVLHFFKIQKLQKSRPKDVDGPSFPEFFPQMQDFIQEKKKDSARTSAKKKKKKKSTFGKEAIT